MAAVWRLWLADHQARYRAEEQERQERRRERELLPMRRAALAKARAARKPRGEEAVRKARIAAIREQIADLEQKIARKLIRDAECLSGSPPRGASPAESAEG
jgi:hypothetical protein